MTRLSLLVALSLWAGPISAHDDPASGAFDPSGWIKSDQLRMHPSSDGLYFLAANPGRGQLAWIDQQGFRMECGGAACRAVSLNVMGHGREGGEMVPWRGGNKSLSGDALEYQGDGMTVQYEHGTAGLRQNFLFAARPDGCGDLLVHLNAGGDGAPVSLSSGAVSFDDDRGTSFLEYSGLRAWDACGDALNARMLVLGRDEIVIRVDDSYARYPIVIDPVAAAPNLLLTNPTGAGAFSQSLRTAGDLNGDGYSDVVVAAPTASMGEANEGVVYVYYGSSAGLVNVPSVTLQSNQASSQFGYSVGTAGDVNGDGYGDLLVGASSWESVLTENEEGGVFVFHGSATGISTTADYILQSNGVTQYMGFSVSCAGDINNDGYSDVITGSPYAYYPTSLEGCAWVFLGSATGLNPVYHKRLERNQGAAQFGGAVAGLGDVNGDGYSDIGIAAHRFDLNGTDDGIICIYHGSAVGIAGAANPAPNAIINAFAYVTNIGWSLAAAGDVNGDGYSDMITGDYRGNVAGGPSQAGCMLVFHGSAAGMSATPATVFAHAQANAFYGRSVSCAGDVNADGYADVLIGATTFTNGQTSEGAGYLHLGSPSGIPAAFTTRYEYNQTGSNMGECVSGAGDVNGDGVSDFLIGMKLYTGGGGALLYNGGPSNVASTASLTRASGLLGARMGSAIADAGDVNGDGFSDALVGAPEASNGQAGEGLVYLHYGSAAGLAPLPSLTLEANVAGARFGASVASAGDVNGDGYADVVVGAPLSGGGGRAYVHHGSAGGLSVLPALVLTGAAGAEFGFSVFTAGDIDADGRADLIVGAPGIATAFVHMGTVTGIDPVVTTVLAGPAGSRFGAAVSTAGDVDGTGYSDVIVGAPLYSNGQSNEGAAYVFKGGIDGAITPAFIQMEPNLANSLLGTSVATGSDMNGDGYYEVVVGAPGWASGQAGEGAAFIYRGSAAGTTAVGMITVQPNVVNAAMGTSVCEGGDLNGDGYADAVIGAPFIANGQVDEGRIYVVEGAPGGIGATVNVESNQTGWRLGASVAGGGDVDGDGFSDLLGGAPYAAPALTDEGAFLLFRGNQALSLSRLTRQLATDLVGPLSTNSFDPLMTDWFGIGHRVKSPIQRTRARLRWEVVFEGQPFSGTPITNSMGFTAMSAAWTNLALPGQEIKELVYKVPGHKRYKWRVRAEYPLNKLIDGQRFGRWHYGYASGVGDIGILPVELLSFTGEAVPAGDLLQWTTATEQESVRFVVERSNDPRSGFVAVGEVAAAGTSRAPIAYSYLHRGSQPGTRYYRLRVVSSHGDDEYSDEIALADGLSTITLMPNPATDLIRWAMPASADSFRIIDAAGRTLISGRSSHADVSALAQGAYLLVTEGGGAVLSTSTFVKR